MRNKPLVKWGVADVCAIINLFYRSVLVLNLLTVAPCPCPLPPPDAPWLMGRRASDLSSLNLGCHSFWKYSGGLHYHALFLFPFVSLNHSLLKCYAAQEPYHKGALGRKHHNQSVQTVSSPLNLALVHGLCHGHTRLSACNISSKFNKHFCIGYMS